MRLLCCTSRVVPQKKECSKVRVFPQSTYSSCASWYTSLENKTEVGTFRALLLYALRYCQRPTARSNTSNSAKRSNYAVDCYMAMIQLLYLSVKADYRYYRMIILIVAVFRSIPNYYYCTGCSRGTTDSSGHLLDDHSSRVLEVKRSHRVHGKLVI